MGLKLGAQLCYDWCLKLFFFSFSREIASGFDTAMACIQKLMVISVKSPMTVPDDDGSAL